MSGSVVRSIMFGVGCDMMGRRWSKPSPWYLNIGGFGREVDVAVVGGSGKWMDHEPVGPCLDI